MHVLAIQPERYPVDSGLVERIEGMIEQVVALESSVLVVNPHHSARNAKLRGLAQCLALHS